MKQTILLFILLLMNSVWSQKTPLNRKLFSYDSSGLHPDSIVVKIDSLTADQLFYKVIKWAKTSKIKGCNLDVFSSLQDQKLILKGKCDQLLRTDKDSDITPIHQAKFTIYLTVSFLSYSFSPKSFGYNNGFGVYTNINLAEKSLSVYKGNDEFKTGFQLFPSAIQNLFNMVETSLYYYLNTGEQLTFKYK